MSKLDFDSILKPVSTIHYKESEGRLELIDLGGDFSVMVIDGLARHVYLAIDGTRNLGSIVELVARVQSVDEEDVATFRSDALAFAEDLLEANIVSVAN
ncbi:MAG: hypothetical protein V4692_09300 [Bdellovibrionota bacterium]